MRHSPSPDQTINPQRVARAAIFNGIPIPATVAAQLEARGINVGELEQRLLASMEFGR